MSYINNQTDTLWADVSEFQNPVNDSYTDAGYRVISIRSDDGSYRDHKFAQNYQWCLRAANDGRLDMFIVYYYWRPNGTGPGTFIDMVNSQGGPHPKMVIMIDVESGGNGYADCSNELNGEYTQLGRWIGSRQRVIAYGNTGDLNAIWVNKPQGLRLVIAGYGANPGYPGKFAHQYTDGVVPAGGLPMGAPPFGNCDMNCADGLSSQAVASICGVGGPVLTPPPTPPPAPVVPVDPTTYTIRPGDTLSAVAAKFGFSLDALLAANPDISNPNLVYIGQVINFPGPDTTSLASKDILEQFGR